MKDDLSEHKHIDTTFMRTKPDDYRLVLKIQDPEERSVEVENSNGY
jgi:hypothetical protein